MKAEDLKTKTPDELKKILLDMRKDLLNMRFQRANAQLEDTSRMRKARRTIARVKMYLSAGASASASASSPVADKSVKGKKKVAQ